MFIAPPRSCVAHACLSIIDARAICLGFRKQYAGGCNSFLTNGSTQKHLAATRYVVACEVFALVFKKGGKYKNPVPLKGESRTPEKWLPFFCCTCYALIIRLIFEKRFLFVFRFLFFVKLIVFSDSAPRCDTHLDRFSINVLSF